MGRLLNWFGCLRPEVSTAAGSSSSQDPTDDEHTELRAAADCTVEDPTDDEHTELRAAADCTVEVLRLFPSSLTTHRWDHPMGSVKLLAPVHDFPGVTERSTFDVDQNPIIHLRIFTPARLADMTSAALDALSPRLVALKLHESGMQDIAFACNGNMELQAGQQQQHVDMDPVAVAVKLHRSWASKSRSEYLSPTASIPWLFLEPIIAPGAESRCLPVGRTPEQIASFVKLLGSGDPSFTFALSKHAAALVFQAHDEVVPLHRDFSFQAQRMKHSGGSYSSFKSRCAYMFDPDSGLLEPSIVLELLRRSSESGGATTYSSLETKEMATRSSLALSLPMPVRLQSRDTLFRGQCVLDSLPIMATMLNASCTLLLYQNREARAYWEASIKGQHTGTDILECLFHGKTEQLLEIQSEVAKGCTWKGVLRVPTPTISESFGQSFAAGFSQIQDSFARPNLRFCSEVDKPMVQTENPKAMSGALPTVSKRRYRTASSNKPASPFKRIEAGIKSEDIQAERNISLPLKKLGVKLKLSNSKLPVNNSSSFLSPARSTRHSTNNVVGASTLAEAGLTFQLSPRLLSMIAVHDGCRRGRGSGGRSGGKETMGSFVAFRSPGRSLSATKDSKGAPLRISLGVTKQRRHKSVVASSFSSNRSNDTLPFRVSPHISERSSPSESVLSKPFQGQIQEPIASKASLVHNSGLANSASSNRDGCGHLPLVSSPKASASSAVLITVNLPSLSPLPNQGSPSVSGDVMQLGTVNSAGSAHLSPSSSVTTDEKPSCSWAEPEGESKVLASTISFRATTTTGFENHSSPRLSSPSLKPSSSSAFPSGSDRLLNSSRLRSSGRNFTLAGKPMSSSCRTFSSAGQLSSSACRNFSLAGNPLSSSCKTFRSSGQHLSSSIQHLTPAPRHSSSASGTPFDAHSHTSSYVLPGHIRTPIVFQVAGMVLRSDRSGDGRNPYRDPAGLRKSFSPSPFSKATSSAVSSSLAEDQGPESKEDASLPTSGMPPDPTGLKIKEYASLPTSGMPTQPTGPKIKEDASLPTSGMPTDPTGPKNKEEASGSNSLAPGAIPTHYRGDRRTSQENTSGSYSLPLSALSANSRVDKAGEAFLLDFSKMSDKEHMSYPSRSLHGLRPPAKAERGIKSVLGVSSSQLPPSPHLESEMQTHSDWVLEESFQWLEITAIPILDPVSGEKSLLLLQTDISQRAELETRMAALTEGQLDMLQNMFPCHVLEYMVMQQHADMSELACSHSAVTIMFMDIVGFTSMSKEVSSQAVMAYLNDMFTQLDDKVSAYGVYKVDTAGDCYIVAGGLMIEDEDGAFRLDPNPDPEQGARRVLQFVQGLMAAVTSVPDPASGNPSLVRVGIHTGSCVSGLIGTKLPKFSLWGDTMNTASRMESTSKPGHVQVSQATYDLLDDSMKSIFTSTGGVEVKGKGMMRTYAWDTINNPHTAPSSVAEDAGYSSYPRSPVNPINSSPADSLPMEKFSLPAQLTADSGTHPSWQGALRAKSLGLPAWGEVKKSVRELNSIPGGMSPLKNTVRPRASNPGALDLRKSSSGGHMSDTTSNKRTGPMDQSEPYNTVGPEDKPAWSNKAFSPLHSVLTPSPFHTSNVSSADSQRVLVESLLDFAGTSGGGPSGSQICQDSRPASLEQSSTGAPGFLPVSEELSGCGGGESSSPQVGHAGTRPIRAGKSGRNVSWLHDLDDQEIPSCTSAVGPSCTSVEGPEGPSSTSVVGLSCTSVEGPEVPSCTWVQGPEVPASTSGGSTLGSLVVEGWKKSKEVRFSTPSFHEVQDAGQVMPTKRDAERHGHSGLSETAPTGRGISGMLETAQSGKGGNGMLEKAPTGNGSSGLLETFNSHVSWQQWKHHIIQGCYESGREGTHLARTERLIPWFSRGGELDRIVEIRPRRASTPSPYNHIHLHGVPETRVFPGQPPDKKFEP